MQASRLLKISVCLSLAICFICALPAATAEENRNHWQVRVIPGAHHPDKSIANTKFDELYLLSEGFGILPPKDSSENDEWPCLPNVADANYADCSNVANGGVVTGLPAFSWSFDACNANSPTSTPCGQVFWFYEDDTNDNTDHLITSITVRQGTNVVLETGNIDHGPNPASVGSIVVISDDVAFGTMGETGKNNGYCAGSKKVCSDLLQGLATISVVSQVGPSRIMKTFNINLQ